MGAVAAIVVLAVFASALLVVLLCIYKRTGCYLRRDAFNPRSDDTYLTPVYDENLQRHGVNASETPTTHIKKHEDYDFLKDHPNAGLRYDGMSNQYNGRDRHCSQNGSSTQSRNSEVQRERLAIT
ncbi:uncharacterized protein LOC127859824 [Dreissena polymorpha]|uniref:uncharacterized protein LOC127859824 n=1 Tax=Dreissena polymorpha TaxID=45954 RepID=UPI002264BD5D|nr:uncharacterized protein LOC127859824 [Dreissena polymorpha]